MSWEPDAGDAQDHSQISTWEMAVVVAGFLGFSGMVFSLAHLQATDIGASDAADPIFSTLKFSAFAYGLWGLGKLRGRLRWSWTVVGLVVLHLLAFASLAWSDARSLTLSRLVQVTLTTLFAVSVGARLSVPQQVKALVIAVSIAVGLCIASVVAVPDFAIMTGDFEGMWRGLFVHKNQLGKFAVMAAAIYASARRARGFPPWLAWVGSGLCVVLIIGSTSRTAFISLFTIWLSFPFFNYLRRRRSVLPHLLTLSSLLVLCGTLVVAHAEDIAEMIGRNLTMTGRTGLWFAVLAFMARRPWLGYGYDTFWRGADGDSAYISLALHWDVPHAHNGWLDVGLDLGVIGVVLMMAIFSGAVVNAFRRSKNIADPLALWPLIALTIVFMANLTESSLFRPSNLTWILLILAVLERPAVHAVEAAGSEGKASAG